MTMLTFAHDDIMKFQFDDGMLMRTIKIETKKGITAGFIREVGGRGQHIHLTNEFALKTGDDIQLPTNGMLLMDLSMPCTLFYNNKELIDFRPQKKILCVPGNGVEHMH